jgi:hypothetical protein
LQEPYLSRLLAIVGRCVAKAAAPQRNQRVLIVDRVFAEGFGCGFAGDAFCFQGLCDRSLAVCAALLVNDGARISFIR